jgi:hypothetical protein
MLTVEAQIDENGNVKILQPLSFSSPRRALVVILDEPAIAETDTEELTATEQEAEDRVWKDAVQRHADKFAELKAQAKLEVARGETIDAFDENGEFTLK